MCFADTISHLGVLNEGSVKTLHENTSAIFLNQSKQDASVSSMAAAQSPIDNSDVSGEPIDPKPFSLENILKDLDPQLQEKVLRNLRFSGAATNEARGSAYTPLLRWLAERDEAWHPEKVNCMVLALWHEQANLGLVEAEQLHGALSDDEQSSRAIDRPKSPTGTFETSEILDGSESFVMIDSNVSSSHNATNLDIVLK
jgi:hypothetical protein